MNPTLWIGFGIVAVGGLVGAFMLFGQRTNPLHAMASTSTPHTIPAASAGGASRTAGAARSPKHSDRRSTDGGDIRIRWYQRLRSFALLLLITIGLGTALGAVVGAVALFVSIVLN